MSLALALSPHHHLYLEPAPGSEPVVEAKTAARLEKAFGLSSASGLELLAGELLATPLPVSLGFWRDFARLFFTRLCHLPDLESSGEKGVPPLWAEDLETQVLTAPPMTGLEYLSQEVLTGLWVELEKQVVAGMAKTGAQAYLQALNPVWNAVGQVTFHLAENKRNTEYPFAFLATYTHHVSAQGKVQHLPLGRALQEYAGAKNHALLQSLLSPVQRAAQSSKLVAGLLESHALFHPQAWTPPQAFGFLKEIPLLEQAGITVRIPNWWKAGHPPRPKVQVRIGEKGQQLLGKDQLLDFQVDLTLEGQPLSQEEWKTILQSTSGLVLLKGQWVEVDRDQLKELLGHWKEVQASVGPDGVSLLQGLRLLSGFNPQAAAGAVEETRPDWSQVVAGGFFSRLLEEMQSPQATGESDPGPELQAELRPYQRTGAHWLWFMHRLGLGACLADDMGLGKTIQVLALLLALKRKKSARATPAPSLLVVPASLLGNWKSELAKFAPTLRVLFFHPSETPAELLASTAADPAAKLAGIHLVITSYGMVSRLDWFKKVQWNLVILDEAQAIKNAGARQSKSVKALPAQSRIALSGTPIENRLSDLWSLFDFICPGLLGGARDFSAFIKKAPGEPATSFAPLRRLVRPYILRRLKTDKTILSDLPDKTELNAFCSLSRAQAVLYQQSVEELRQQLEQGKLEGIQRRGIILAFLTRLKQVCNHPSLYLGDGSFLPEQSGKFDRLRALAEEIAAKQEKVLLFTQYREMTEPLAAFLKGIFGKSGLVLHGGTPVKKRQSLVAEFQKEEGPPFFVLSLKAGGTGLNLTAAAHVIHFDRWWNPAVENQATDRAYRIGQKRNVLVHKFICRGTMEERIHELITSKLSLAGEILGEGAEPLLTEMTNSQLLNFVALDIKAVGEE